MVVLGMKHFRVLVIAFALTGLLNTPAVAQTSFRSYGDELALLFCSYVRANDSTAFRNKLRELRLRIRDIYPRIRCNGESMIQFAAHSQSHDIGRFIAHSVLIEDLNDVGDLSWVKQLEHDHPISQALRERTDSSLQK